MMIWITSRANPRVQALAALRLRKYREIQSLTLAEGLHLVAGALVSSVPLRSFIIAQSAADRPEVIKLLDQAREVALVADGVIVGAALVRAMTESTGDVIDSVGRLALDLASAVHGATPK